MWVWVKDTRFGVDKNYFYFTYSVWLKSAVYLLDGLMEAGTLTTFEKYLEAHLKCYSMQGYEPNAGNWDWYRFNVVDPYYLKRVSTNMSNKRL